MFTNDVLCRQTYLKESYTMSEQNNFEKQLLSLTSQMNDEDKANLLFYVSQLIEQRNQEQPFSHPRPYQR